MRVEQDYYDVLGVGQDATAEEIKRAFRRLARTLHPDVAPEVQDGTFHDVVAAYQVLSHPRRRSLYDRLGLGGRQAPVPAPPAGVPPVELTLQWYEAERGTSKLVEFEEPVTCVRCAGAGIPGGVVAAVCVRCRGAGRFNKVTESASMRLVEVHACTACAGVGHAPIPVCLDCDGAGSTRRARSLRIRTPAGVRDGDQIRVDGVEPRFRVEVTPRPHDSRPVLRLAALSLLCALGLLLYLLIR
jgi:molecular chaperone DnaJ